MSKHLIIIIFVLFMFSSSSFASQDIDNVAGFPVRFIGGCEADFDKDSVNDLAFFYEGSSGTELIVLLVRKKGYKSILLYKGQEKNIHLSCQYSNTVKETSSGKGKVDGKKHVINGFILKLTQPESSSSLFYWKNGKFIKIWLTD